MPAAAWVSPLNMGNEKDEMGDAFCPETEIKGMAPRRAVGAIINVQSVDAARVMPISANVAVANKRIGRYVAQPELYPSHLFATRQAAIAFDKSAPAHLTCVIANIGTYAGHKAASCQKRCAGPTPKSFAVLNDAG